MASAPSIVGLCCDEHVQAQSSKVDPTDDLRLPEAETRNAPGLGGSIWNNVRPNTHSVSCNPLGMAAASLQGCYRRRLVVLRWPDKPRENRYERRESAVIDPKRDICGVADFLEVGHKSTRKFQKFYIPRRFTTDIFMTWLARWHFHLGMAAKGNVG